MIQFIIFLAALQPLLMSALGTAVQNFYLLTFQLSYQNKSCSECKQDVRKIERQGDRQTDRSQTELNITTKLTVPFVK